MELFNSIKSMLGKQIEKEVKITETITDGVSDKVRNPFIFTFIITWIIHNWTIVYSFFFIDQKCTLEEKIEYFKQYWRQKNLFGFHYGFIGDLIICIVVATIVLIITYLCKLGSKKLSILYNNSIIRISNTRLITKEEYKELQKEIDSKQNEIDKLQGDRVKFDSKINQKEDIIGNLNNEKSKLNDEFDEFKKANNKNIEQKNKANFDFNLVVNMLESEKEIPQFLEYIMSNLGLSDSKDWGFEAFYNHFGNYLKKSPELFLNNYANLFNSLKIQVISYLIFSPNGIYVQIKNIPYAQSTISFLEENNLITIVERESSKYYVITNSKEINYKNIMGFLLLALYNRSFIVKNQSHREKR
ncbi:BAR domain-containing protein [Rhizosphaericola mali]|uniref:Uncharacterized protein n=1 Tax=Rhizosphaericola mali TaxID=2545455 RepID=A0A5P2G2L7_9BACT|nr:hypothetical protein [Rhizosphaericola mali]QES89725.1 hypothetical protein E0W69_014000 [Rhizosphaericola mali]